MNDRSSKTVLIGLVFGSGLLSAGCFNPSDDVGETDGNTSAELRVVHASPDAGPVDVYVVGSDEPLVLGLEYTQSSMWLGVPIGDFSVALRAAGAPADSAPAYTSEVLSIAEGDRVSAIAAGLLAGSGDTALRVVPVAEQWGTELAGRARIRVIHAGADAPSIEVDGLEGDPASLDRYAGSDASGIPVDVAGGEQIEILADGALVTSFTTPPLAQGDTVLVVATGLLGKLAREDDGFALVTVGQGGPLGTLQQDPELFTLHGARDAGALEHCIGSLALAEDIEYGEIQSRRVSPGAYDVTLFGYPSGCLGTVLNSGTNSTDALEAGERYLLLITGENSPEGDPLEPGLQVVTLLDQFTLGDQSAGKYRFVHGASAEQIFVGSIVNGEISTNNVYTDAIGWRSESAMETSLMMGTYLLGVADATNSADPPQATLDPIVEVAFTVEPGDRQWGVVSGDPSPDGADDGFLQLMIVDTVPSPWGARVVDLALVEP